MNNYLGPYGAAEAPKWLRLEASMKSIGLTLSDAAVEDEGICSVGSFHVSSTEQSYG